MYNSKHIASAILSEINEGTPMEVIEKNLLRYLKDLKIESELKEIVRHLEHLLMEKKKWEEVTIETAHPTSKKLLEEIRSSINAPATADIEPKINEDLIGGFVATYKGTRFDTSLKTKLNKLEEELINA